MPAAPLDFKSAGFNLDMLGRKAIPSAHWPTNEKLPKGFITGQLSREVTINGVTYPANVDLVLPIGDLTSKYLKP